MFYNKYFKNNYDELITYYPKYYREVLEMKAILESEGKLADDMEDNIERVFNNCFIDTADENTIGNLEKFLSLSLYKQRSLDERRRLVKSLFVGGGKISASMISGMIAAYTGASVACRLEPFDEYGNNKLYIDFSRGEEKTLYMSDIFTLIERRIPAHIEYRIAVVYSFPIGIGRNKNSYTFVYDLCGTKPYSILIARIEGAEAAAKAETSKAVMEYRQSSDGGTEPQTGLYPQVATLGHTDVIDAITGAIVSGCGVDYIPCGTIYSGIGG